MRVIAFIFGLAVAATGGVMAYRALFLEPSSAVLITEKEVREFPDALRVAGGLIMLILGAAIAFLAARRRRS